MCSVELKTNKYKKKRGPRKHQLTVNKVSITRGSRAAGFYETNETTQMQTSPTTIIEDASTSPSQDIDNKLKTLQIQSRSRRSQDNIEPRELRRTSRNSGRYVEGQYMESDSE